MTKRPGRNKGYETSIWHAIRNAQNRHIGPCAPCAQPMPMEGGDEQPERPEQQNGTKRKFSVGEEVLYDSSSNGALRTTVVAVLEEDEEHISLACKRHASLSKVSPAPPEENAEAPSPAVGGIRSESGGSGLEPEDQQASVDAYVADVVTWLAELAKNAAAECVSIPAMMRRLLAPNQQTKEMMLAKIPWKVQMGYINFLKVPRTSSNGTLHVCMLSFNEEAYPGNGIYLADAAVLLEKTAIGVLLAKRIELRPRSPMAELATFGWEPDGAMINGTYCFLLSTLAIYSVYKGCQIPAPIADGLAAIGAHYTRHESPNNRLVNSLVASAAAALANRSPGDPLWLANELMRNSVAKGNVRVIMKLYKQQTMANRALQMKPMVEECTLRFMGTDKVCNEVKHRIAQIVQTHGWLGGPFTAHLLMAPAFVLGAALGESYSEVWKRIGVQTASGQSLAVQCYETDYESAGAKQGKLLDQNGFNALCVASGVWEQLKIQVLPSLMLPPQAVDELQESFVSGGAFRSAVGGLGDWEPPDHVTDIPTLMSSLLKKLPDLQALKDALVRETSEAARNLPNAIMSRKECIDLSVACYSAEITLDVNSYRAAVQLLDDEVDAGKQAFEVKSRQLTEDVRRFQDLLQQSDISIWPPPVGMRRSRGAWIKNAVLAAAENQKRVQTLAGVDEHGVSVVNVFSMNALGTLKETLVQKVQEQCLDVLRGVTIIFFPTLAKKTQNKSLLTFDAAVGAAGSDAEAAEDALVDSDSDVDPAYHDYSADGALPEALTQAIATKSCRRRSAQLASDMFYIESKLGHDNLQARYPMRVHFMRTEVAGREGCEDIAEAFLLLPVDEKPGTGLDTSTLVRAGVYTQVPKQESFCKVSRKVALQAKQAMANGWCFEEEQVQRLRDVTTKVTRGELGTGLHAHWLRDLVNNCKHKVLLINDFIMGTGEVALAAVGAKASMEATSNDVRVCYFGHDPRKLFHEVARARCRTLVGNLYLDKKLTMHGHPPPERLLEAAVKNLKMVQSKLPAPLRRLQIDADGRLIIPTAADVAASCPVEVTPELSNLFEVLRSEFPRPQGSDSGQPLAALPAAPAAQAGAESSGEPQNTAAEPTPVPNDTMAGSQDPHNPFKPGTVFQKRDSLQAVHLAVAKECPLPHAAADTLKDIKVVLCSVTQSGGKTYVVLLENASSGNISIPAGTFIGRGGVGRLVSLSTEILTPEESQHAWLYTRIKEHKRDQPTKGSGALVFQKSDGKGQPLAASGPPKMVTVEEVEQDVGGKLTTLGPHHHTFHYEGHRGTGWCSHCLGSGQQPEQRCRHLRSELAGSVDQESGSGEARRCEFGNVGVDSGSV